MACRLELKLSVLADVDGKLLLDFLLNFLAERGQFFLLFFPFLLAFKVDIVHCLELFHKFWITKARRAQITGSMGADLSDVSLSIYFNLLL